MNFLQMALLVSVAALGGCAAVPLPEEAAKVTLVGVSSPNVEIHRPRLIWKGGRLNLETYALRQWAAETTAHTHIDITCLDAAGRTMSIARADLPPRSLPRTIRWPAPHAHVLQPIRLPSGTAGVEVKAHDGPHHGS